MLKNDGNSDLCFEFIDFVSVVKLEILWIVMKCLGMNQNFDQCY